MELITLKIRKKRLSSTRANGFLFLTSTYGGNFFFLSDSIIKRIIFYKGPLTEENNTIVQWLNVTIPKKIFDQGVKDKISGCSEIDFSIIDNPTKEQIKDFNKTYVKE